MKAFKKVVSKYNSVSLIFRIFIGICIGVILALTVPKASWIALAARSASLSEMRTVTRISDVEIMLILIPSL